MGSNRLAALNNMLLKAPPLHAQIEFSGDGRKINEQTKKRKKLATKQSPYNIDD